MLYDVTYFTIPTATNAEIKTRVLPTTGQPTLSRYRRVRVRSRSRLSLLLPD